VANSQAAECSLTCDFLSAVGYEVAASETGEDAVRMCKERHARLILANIQMPDNEGQSLIRLLSTSPGSAGLPLIALTSLSFVGARDLILRAGANEYLLKPIRLDHMAELVRTLLPVGEG